MRGFNMFFENLFFVYTIDYDLVLALKVENSMISYSADASLFVMCGMKPW